MRVVLIVLTLACGSCLGNAATDDAAVPDMAFEADLANLDLLGALNCLQLNQCTSLCKNLMCVAACRDRATPAAKAKENDLQLCFNQNCPQTSDMASPICAPDSNGDRSAACLQCIANTQKASAGECVPPGAPECQKCFGQAKVCRDDK
jgi:hypothetical protein